MLFLLLAGVVATSLALVLTPWIQRLCLAAGILDLPDARKVHATATPRFGGAAIYLAFLLTGLGAYWYHEIGYAVPFRLERFAGIMLGGTIILLVGIYDDLWDLSAGRKLVCQIVAAGVVAFFLELPSAVVIPGIGEWQLGVLSWLFAVCWIVATANAFNLIDGIDGLSSGLAAIAALSWSMMAMHADRLDVAFYLVVLAGSVLGFLRYNAAPAKVFLGGCGALFIGFALGVTSLFGLESSVPAGLVLALPLTIAIPLLDVVLAFLRRARRATARSRLEGGTPRWRTIFEPDRDHLHHRLLRAGLTRRQAVTYLHLLAMLLGATATVAALRPPPAGEVLALYLAIALPVALRWIARTDGDADLKFDPRTEGTEAPGRVLVWDPDPEARWGSDGAWIADVVGAQEGVLEALDRRGYDVVVIGAALAPDASRALAGSVAQRQPCAALIRRSDDGERFELLGTEGAHAGLGEAVRVGRCRATANNRRRYRRRLFWLSILSLPVVAALALGACRRL